MFFVGWDNISDKTDIAAATPLSRTWATGRKKKERQGIWTEWLNRSGIGKGGKETATHVTEATNGM